MKKFAIAILLNTIFCSQPFAQAKQQILQVISKQQTAWNHGDIDGFMKGYWNNDSLMFIGKSGITYGWQKTMDNYKKGYPDTAHMGKLAFDILKIKKVNRKNYFVVGKWFLSRSIGNVGGHFTLWLRKIMGQWKIVADHTS